MGTELILPNSYPPTLVRWLNVNAVVQLGRTRTYIDVPAFQIDNTWEGYSHIIGEFKVASPNNISLVNLSLVAPTTPNYLLCVSYVNADNTVVRYKLWEDVGEVLFFEIPLYTGQLLKKNFKFEIWNTDNDSIEQTTTLRFTTSLLGLTDTRYGTDTALATAASLCEGQQSVIAPVTTLPTTGLAFNFDPALNVVAAGGLASRWTDAGQYGILLYQNTGSAQPGYAAEVFSAADNTDSLYTYPAGIAAHHTYFIINLATHVNGALIFNYGSTAKGILSQVNPSGSIKWDFGGLSVTSDPLTLGVWYLVELKGFGSPLTMRIFTLEDGILRDTKTSAGLTLEYTAAISIGAAGTFGAVFSWRNLVAYQYPQSDADRLLTLKYLLNRYNTSATMNLPLVFGACSQPTLNS